jgi:hypothetical protein
MREMGPKNDIRTEGERCEVARDCWGRCEVTRDRWLLLVTLRLHGTVYRIR